MKALAYRTNRATYAAMLAILVVLVTIFLGFSGKSGPTEVIAAFIVIPRLHDVGRSGWWYLPLVIGEIVAAVVGYQMGGVENAYIVAGFYIFFVLALFILLALVPGQPAANKWGYPPPPGISWKRPASEEERLKEIF